MDDRTDDIDDARPRAPANMPGDPAVADAQAVLDRIRDDERAARAERERLNQGGDLRPVFGGLDAPPLHAGEAWLDTRPAARLERVGPDDTGALTGRLHLTTTRLVLSGREPLDVPLETVEEVSVVGERLLVEIAGGGLRVDIASPRLFRVRMAAALARLRAASARAPIAAPGQDG